MKHCDLHAAPFAVPFHSMPSRADALEDTGTLRGWEWSEPAGQTSAERECCDRWGGW